MDLVTMLAVIRRGVPLAEEWGVELLEAEGGRALLRLPASARLLRPGNTVSGPALMGLADVAMWAALLSLTGARDDSVTSTMTVNFLRPAGSGPVLAEARIVKRGKRMLFGEILLRAEGSEETAVHATTMWAVITPAAR
jgi:uncharacterized protein (TIGR00369 family)